MKWPFWRRKLRLLRIEPVRREVSRLTVAEWRADPGWAAMAASILSDSRLQQMMDAVANSSPAFEVLPLGAMPHERAAQQARAEGYTMALANLAALGRQEAMRAPVEALFSAEERA
jgi:hypothetical protein